MEFGPDDEVEMEADRELLMVPEEKVSRWRTELDEIDQLLSVLDGCDWLLFEEASECEDEFM